MDRLNLQTFQIDGSYQVEGIDKSSTTIPVSKATVVQFSLYNQPVEVTCFVSDHANLQDHILLGLNFIFENMRIALRWVTEAKPQNKTQEIIDRCRSANPFIQKKQVVPSDFEFKLADTRVQKFKAWPVSIRKMNKLLRKKDETDEISILLIRQARIQSPKEYYRLDTQRLIQEIKQKNKDVIRSSLPDSIDYQGKILHHIDIIPGSQPAYNRAYRMSVSEQQELSKQIDELIRAGRIYPTTSPYGAPVLFVRKKDGSQRLCCDFRKLNQTTIKSRFPLPLIDELFDQLHGAKWFSTLDLISGYHQIPVSKEDQYKTAFVTTQGQYAWRVMPFGLTNAPSTFQMIMQDVLREYIGKFVVVYLDDVLVYSKDQEAHAQHLQLVLDKFRKVRLYVKEAKTCLFQTNIKWLGHYINASGIQVDPEKVSTVVNWPEPQNSKETKQFLGLCSYYRNFVPKFSAIARPLHRFAAGKENWGSEQKNSFEQLKQQLITAPVLKPFSGTDMVRVTTDASKEAVGAVLELVDRNNKVIGPVAYLSKALQSYQLNWPIREKELFAIVHALRHWKHYLKGRQFQLYTDHKSLESIMKNYELNDRLQNWVSFLMQFSFTIKYIPGETNVADSLSRIAIRKLTFTIGSVQESVSRRVKEGYKDDRHLSFIIEILKGERQCPADYKTIITRYRLQNSLLYYGYCEGIRNRLVIPYGELRLELLRMYHSSAIAGHPGANRTYARLAQHYYWKGMQADVLKFVKSCHNCQTSKNSHQLPVGVFHPLQIPTRRFEAINIDFVSGMEPDGIFEQIMVVTDRLTKWAITVPLPKKVSTLQIAEMVFDKVILQYGIPRFIVSDRDPKFTNSLWEYFMSRLGISTNFSTANNPQSDGQVERLNKTLVEMLRTYCQGRSQWVKYLQIATFSYNTCYQTSIGCTPFLALRGFQERFTGIFNPIWDRPKYRLPKKGEFGKLAARKAMTDFVENMESQLVVIRDQIAQAQERQSKYFNQKHRDIPQFKIGDKILIHKKAYVSSDSRRKFHYLWFGPFTIKSLVGDQAVEVHRGELANNKKHNVFNIRYVKRYYPFESQFHFVPPATLKDLRKNPSQISRIVDVLRENEETIFLVLIDNATEIDLVKIREEDLRTMLAQKRLDYLWNKFRRNKTWLQNPVTSPFKG